MRHFSHPSQRRARLALWLAALAALAVLQGGVATADPAPQIVGGRDADPGEYPFAVALLARGLSGTARDRQFCTGSLVAPRWVLTAAHCTFTGGGQALLVQDVEVVVNRTDINDTNQGQLRTIKRIARHPFYNHLEYLGGSQWDAALLELNEPVPNVEPIELASVDDDPLERNDRELTAIGWGYTDPEGTKTPAKLQEVELPAVDDATCKERFKNAGIWEADDMTFAVTLCAGGIVGKDTCSGDSGGPLLGRDEDGDWVQTGITSARFGELCAQSLPSIFTEVNSSLIEDDEPSIWDWVTETAGIHGKAVFSPISGGPDMLVGVQVFNREGVEVKVNVVSGGPATGPNPGTETFYGSRTLPPRSSGEPLIFTPPEERGPIRIETVDASARVDATVNYIRRTDGDKIATVEAITAGEHVQYLPLLARDNDGRGNALPGDSRPGADHNLSDGVSSFFWLQNTSMRATSAQVEYFKDGELLGDDTYVIPARIGVLVRQRDLKVDLDTTRSGAITREEEVFSAKVTSDERVATAVMQEDASQLLGYRAFGQDAPATMLSAPLVMANNGASTGVQVQNTGTRDTEVTITYSANIANPAGNGRLCRLDPATAFTKVTVKPGGFATFIQTGGEAGKGFDNRFAGCRYIGSATVTASDGQGIVGVVNQVGGGTNGSYELLDPAKLRNKATVNLANINNRSSGGDTITGLNIQNLGFNSAPVWIEFGANSAKEGDAGQPAPCRPSDLPVLTPTIPATGVHNAVFGPDPADIPGAIRELKDCRFIGPITITAKNDPTAKLAVIANQITPGTRDGLGTVSVTG
jgi:hypothetical protein